MACWHKSRPKHENRLEFQDLSTQLKHSPSFDIGCRGILWNICIRILQFDQYTLHHSNMDSIRIRCTRSRTALRRILQGNRKWVECQKIIDRKEARCDFFSPLFD